MSSLLGSHRLQEVLLAKLLNPHSWQSQSPSRPALGACGAPASSGLSTLHLQSGGQVSNAKILSADQPAHVSGPQQRVSSNRRMGSQIEPDCVVFHASGHT